MVWPDDLYGIILAVVFGALIGLGREISGKAAGAAKRKNGWEKQIWPVSIYA